MKEEEKGWRAFPMVFEKIVGEGMKEINIQKGMSLRDYLAAKAMQGDWAAEVAGANGETMEDSARRYYKMADAMLEAREQ